MQLYSYEATLRRAENLNRSYPASPIWSTGEHKRKLRGSDMKKIANTQKASTDDIYYVSAADVADKLMERMGRGLDPFLFSNSSLALFPVGPWLRTRVRRKLD
jgi:hypothetical protein